ncbi:hypothetical protein [Agarilytica rhodophyticola]|uniref:hypothetical protein n=1 Tax=Agarilytica rhodophyticola TaxID=1737490 RepID=UPI000B344298|nr:hypothetical protein [Agarilytica rhodophyticola]
MCIKKKIASLFFIAPLFLNTIGCSSTTLDNNSLTESAVKEEHDIEPIYAMEIREKSLWFLVQSNGCTSEKSFHLDIKKRDNQEDLITLYRVRKDPCRGMPITLALTSPLPEENIGNRSFLVKNPFITKPIEHFQSNLDLSKRR